MSVQNFNVDLDHVNRVAAMLATDEDLVATIDTDQRFISVTSGRLILHEKSGGYSVIRNAQIAAIEVSDGRNSPEKFLKIYFGGGLSRTVSVPDDEQATAIVSAAARG